MTALQRGWQATESDFRFPGSMLAIWGVNSRCDPFQALAPTRTSCCKDWTESKSKPSPTMGTLLPPNHIGATSRELLLASGVSDHRRHSNLRVWFARMGETIECLVSCLCCLCFHILATLHSLRCTSAGSMYSSCQDTCVYAVKGCSWYLKLAFAVDRFDSNCRGRGKACFLLRPAL